MRSVRVAHFAPVDLASTPVASAVSAQGIRPGYPAAVAWIAMIAAPRPERLPRCSPEVVSKIGEGEIE
jgi:hypothetical protein